MYDLPSDILSTLQHKDDLASISSTQEAAEVHSGTKSQDDDPRSAAVAKACSLCNQSFTTVEDQRSHIRSDVHNYNLKQKLRGLGAVSELEFEDLVKGRHNTNA